MATRSSEVSELLLHYFYYIEVFHRVLRTFFWLDLLTFRRFLGIAVRRNYTKRIGFCSKQRGADRPYTFEKLTLRTLATTPVVPKMPLAKPEPLLSSQVCFSKKIAAADYFIIAPLFFQPQDVQDLPGSPQTLLDIGRIHTTSLGAPTALNPSPSTNYSSDDQM